MSLRLKMWSVLDVVLRVPPVFVMDAVLNTASSIPTSVVVGTYNSTPYYGPRSDGMEIKTEPSFIIIEKMDWLGITWFLLYCKCFLGALVIFMLTSEQLLCVYLWLASVGVILWSFICNDEYLKYCKDLSSNNSNILYEMFVLNQQALVRFCGNYFLQMFFAIIFCFSSSWQCTLIPKNFVGISFILPTVISVLPVSFLGWTPVAAAAVALFFHFGSLIQRSRNIIEMLWNNIQLGRNVIRHYGMYTFVENQWMRLHVPQVLRVFWVIRIVEQAVLLLANTAYAEYKSQGFVTVTIESVLAVFKELLIRGCETFVAVLGMTSIISSISQYIGYAMQSFLLLEDSEDRSIGNISAFLFFILALQTGLTGMEPEKRFMRLYRNTCLLFTAILHFIHTMVNPLLLSLSASTNTSLNKHGRALSVCAFLILFPCWFVMFLCARHPISTWLLAVSAFSIEVVIKVVISLLVYTLFIIDAYRNTFWEKLDDYVYYIRATGSTIEFIFGIFLFFNGAWILFFESGGTVRACMMCIHAYINIWLQAKSGWKTFMNRRSAVNKINSLPEATEEQLTAFDDVCAICYQELNNARITRCNHYFHGVCLRKWLYVQDICPLCHKTLYTIEPQGHADMNAANPDLDLPHEHQD